MKRTAALLLVLSLLFCACSIENTPDVPATGDTPPLTDTTGSTGTTGEDPADPLPPEDTGEGSVPEEQPPVLAYRHPLTGKGLAEPWYGTPVAVVVNNIREAQPLYGLSYADILYEVETEGGITRMLALVSDLAALDKIGPIRSTRTFFNSIALTYGAPLIHCGGSAAALRGHYDDSYDTIYGWQHINEQYNGSYFYRDQDRTQDGYDYEHTLFSTGEKLLQGMVDKGYYVDRDTPADFGLIFADSPEISGSTANTVTVNFRGGKTTTMTYNADTGLYEAAQYGSDFVDAATGETLSFRNVLVLYTSQWFIYDGTYYRSYYDLIGSGDGVYACDGQLIPIKWTRDKLRGTFTYTLEDGTPLTLGAGQSYIAVTHTKAQASYS